MGVRFEDIPKEKLDRLQLRVHPGFKRRLEHHAIDLGRPLEVVFHDLMESVLGDPGPLEPKTRPLIAAHQS